MGEGANEGEGNEWGATLEGGVLYARDPRAGSMAPLHDTRDSIAAGLHIMRAWRSGSGCVVRNRAVGHALWPAPTIRTNMGLLDESTIVIAVVIGTLWAQV